jgi:hypothetical protein
MDGSIRISRVATTRQEETTRDPRIAQEGKKVNRALNERIDG